jgi:ribosomal protein S18 acetylase RimI-like enzyme/uncharacterized damage-inducible protein DinB
MDVRTAEAVDIDQLAQVWYDGWQEAHAAIVPPELARLRSLESFRERLHAALPNIRVLGPRGSPVGFCIVREAELYQLFVSAQSRGSGIAAALIADAEARLAESGVETAWLACAIGNERAARFYEKCGWHRVGIMVNHAETAEGTFPLEVWRYERRIVMSQPAIPLKEFNQEMVSTRKLLERVPTEKGPWKPHEKSFALGHLAQLVSWMPGWITNSLREPHIDLATAGGYSFEPTEALLREFDRNVEGAREALASVVGPTLETPWSLKHGEQVLFTAPRGEVVRGHLNHLIHHRGQLTVYLRLVNVPLPPIYGPTADERM